MVQAIVNISDKANRVLNIIKAKFGLRTKSEAINVMAKEYEEQVLEHPFRPEFVEEMKRVSKEKAIPIKDFAKRYGLK
ncbi:MAG: DUF2683 family protein [Candidatus Woesearchaeota archaeon]